MMIVSKQFPGYLADDDTSKFWLYSSLDELLIFWHMFFWRFRDWGKILSVKWAKVDEMIEINIRVDTDIFNLIINFL